MTDRYEQLLALHHRDRPLLFPNPWDAGSARVLAGLGFKALATTSGGFAATLGRLDGAVTREQALGHARTIAAAVDVPVSADFENGYADDPDDVAQFVREATDTGLGGCSIEDWSGTAIYDAALAADRVAAAAAAAHAGPVKLVLTARAENFLRGITDLDDTIARLQSFEAAGADVLYAPVVTDLEQIRTLVSAVSAPVNVLLLKGGPSVAELAEAGVARISVGGHFANIALGALAEAGREFLAGDDAFLDRTAAGRVVVQAYFD